MRNDEKNHRKLWKMMLQVIMLQVLLMGILAGCADVSENDNQQESAETEAAQKNEEEETVQKDEVFRMLGAPILTIEEASMNCYDVDGKLSAKVTYDTVSLEGDGFETVSQAILEWNERDIGNLVKMGRDCTYDRINTASLGSYVECLRMDSSVISLKQQWYGTDWYYLGVNFDVVSGKRLVLSDILVDEEGFKEKAMKPIIEKLQEVLDTDKLNGYDTDAGQDWISEYIDISSMWYLDAVGIVFFFDPSGIEPYIYDSATVTIPYEDVAECMKSEYCGMHGAGVARFSVNEPVRVNLSEEKFIEKDAVNGSSGTEILSWDTVMLAFDGDEIDVNWGSEGSVSIIINDLQEDMEAYYWISDAYLLCQITGETYLLFDDVNLDHHGCITYLYDITNGEIIKKEECGAWIAGNVNARSCTLGEIVEVFGTYFIKTPYSIREESLRFVRAEVRDIYTGRTEREMYSLNVIRDLPVFIDGEKTSLPPGSKIIITAIDDSKIVYFEEINTGIEGEIHYTGGNNDEEGPICVDGVEESDYFEYLPYSG